jgi:hypothetical protein
VPALLAHLSADCPSWPLSRPNVGPESGHSLCDRARPLA